jgi:hypothetical protein
LSCLLCPELEHAGLVPDGELGDAVLASGADAERDTPRLAAAMDEMLASADRREALHRLISGLRGHGQEVLGRWADVMVNSTGLPRCDCARGFSWRSR